MTAILAGLLRDAGKDRADIEQVVELWRLRNDWQRDKSPKLLAAFLNATKSARAWNRIRIVRSADDSR